MAKRSLAHGVAAAVILVGLGTLLGWGLGSEPLKRGIAWGVAMNPTTALSFILAGASLWLCRAEPASRRDRRIAAALAGTIALIALIRLGGYLLGAAAGIDTLLFRDRLADAIAGGPSRMAPSAALNFLLVAAALLLLDVETRGGRRPAQILALVTGAIAALALVSFGYGASVIPMALTTAATFLLLSVGLFAARPGRGLLAALAAWPLRRRVNYGFASAVGVLLFVGVLAGWGHVRASAAFAERRAVTNRRIQLLRLNHILNEALRGERGYLLTRDTLFLRPYFDARDSVAAILGSVTELYAGVPAETQRAHALAPMVQDAMAVFAQTISLSTAGNQAAALAIVRQGRGKLLMDGIRDTIEVLLAHDEMRVTQLDAAALAADRFAFAINVGAGLMAVVLLLGAARTINRDIAQRERAEAALRESESRLFQILEAIPVGVFVVDGAGLPYYANRTSKAILGEGLDREIGTKRLAERYQVYVAGTTDPYPPERIPFVDALAGRTMGPIADAEVHRPDRIVPLEFSAAPVFDAAGRVAFAICVFSDITERRELEKLRDNLIHMLVHDLRSPLTAIRAYLDLAKMDPDKLDPDVRDSIDEASSAATHMTEMVSDLIDVSRLEAGAMPLARSAVDLGALTAEAMSSVGAAAQRVAVRFDPPARPVIAFCDRGVIRRVIANLLANAIKFTPASGTIRVRIDGEHGVVRVVVSDTGPGIAPEHHAKIFEKFGQVDVARQGAKRSSGLGLTYCKLAVEAHGGRIGVASTLGTGSTFWFELPTE
jgi:signal transduction histidine kinase/CHASE3 domain sensor protein